jgi:hypothetical protein
VKHGIQDRVVSGAFAPSSEPSAITGRVQALARMLSRVDLDALVRLVRRCRERGVTLRVVVDQWLETSQPTGSGLASQSSGRQRIRRANPRPRKGWWRVLFPFSMTTEEAIMAGYARVRRRRKRSHRF